MNKLITITILLLTSFTVSSQNPLFFFNVINIDTTSSKDELYSRSKIWFVQTYNSAEAVIHLDDKVKGIIIGKGIFEYKTQTNKFLKRAYAGMIRYTISVYFKDGRYKYEVTDFIHTSTDPYVGVDLGTITDQKNKFKDKNANDSWNEIQGLCLSYTDSLVDDLKSTMIIEDETENDDW
jgi:hypothetical protein